MSRELKFRVWDTLVKSFIYPDKGYQGHYIISLKGEFVNLQNGSGGKEYVVQQFIGLLDKNGKEIYEGDIVNYKEYNEIDDFTIDVNLVCIYSPYNAWFSFVVDVENEHDEGYYWMEIKDKCEVVGNIFEKL